MSRFIFIAVGSYLLGSIPFGYLLVRMFRGEDVRLSGSGNIGATNVSRKSPMLGAATLILDAMKGGVSVLVAHRLAGAADTQTLMAMAAFFAVLGHVAPVWLKFRGGKGVATGLGSFFVLTPKAVLVALGIFIVVAAIFRYVSLGSIVAVAAYPLLVLKGEVDNGEGVALIFIFATSLLIVVRHHENVRRLLAGTEHRVGAKRA